MNIRQAILKAADSIEARPELYLFMTNDYPNHECGTPACAVGWVLFHLHDKNTGQWKNNAIESNIEFFRGVNDAQFYERMDRIGGDWAFNQERCVANLRFYADKYHPIDKAKTDHIPASVRAIFEPVTA